MESKCIHDGRKSNELIGTYVVIETALFGNGSNELLQAIDIINGTNLTGTTGTPWKFVESGHNVVRLFEIDNCPQSLAPFCCQALASNVGKNRAINYPAKLCNAIPPVHHLQRDSSQESV